MQAPNPVLNFASWIVWQDEHFVAVNKPAGVLSQGGDGGAGINLVDLAREHFGSTWERTGVLHRIDRNVSGLVLLSNDPRAARGFARLMESHAIEREYIAVVRAGSSTHRAVTDPKSGRLFCDAWLRKNELTNEVECVEARAEQFEQLRTTGFKPSRTEWVVQVNTPRASLLRVWPITGRSHQIRAHLSWVGMSIIGDPKYGRLDPRWNRPLLHAVRLAFKHPLKLKRVEIETTNPWNVDASTGVVTERST